MDEQMEPTPMQAAPAQPAEQLPDTAAQDPAEVEIQARISELEEEIARLRSSLEELQKSKLILFLSEAALRDELTRFFTLGLGMPTGASELSKEGFWMISEALGEEWCFGEVRDSPDGNVTREMVSRVMINRHDAGKADDFPAVLVVNTFHSRPDIADRDEPLPEDIVRRAAEDHTVVVRTLDLVRLRQKEASGFPGIKDFQDAIRNGGGWFEVNASLASKLHA
jgi:hypothetical protein